MFNLPDILQSLLAPWRRFVLLQLMISELEEHKSVSVLNQARVACWNYYYNYEEVKVASAEAAAVAAEAVTAVVL